MILEIKNISKSYNSVNNAINNVSINIEKGSINGLIGLNGAGKSTLTKMICGILQPDRGEILFNGLKSTNYNNKIKKKMGILFGQRSSLWWDLPVIDTFELHKIMYDIDDEKFKNIMSLMDKYLSINELMDKVARSLSLGQKTLINVALTLLHNPELVILDEPTIGVDFIVKNKIRKFIKFYNENFGTTFIITSHDLGDIESLCNRIIVLDNGEIIYDDNIENILKINNDTMIITVKENVKLSIFSDKQLKNQGNDYYCSKEDVSKNFEYLSNKILKGDIISIKHNNDFSSVLEKIYDK